MGRALRIPAFLIVLSLFSVAMIVAAPTDPQICSPPSGPPNGMADGRDPLFWSQPPDLNGSRTSSEIIPAYGVESEVADDFVRYGSTHLVRMWGGYWDWIPGDPEIPSLNVRLYEDAGGVPGAVVAEYLGLPIHAAFIANDDFGPIYQYDFCLADAFLVEGRRYWIGIQAGDHPFPPRWGRQQALTQVDYEAMFRSAYFGYPDWTPVSALGGCTRTTRASSWRSEGPARAPAAYRTAPALWSTQPSARTSTVASGTSAPIARAPIAAMLKPAASKTDPA